MWQSPPRPSSRAYLVFVVARVAIDTEPISMAVPRVSPVATRVAGMTCPVTASRNEMFTV